MPEPHELTVEALQQKITTGEIDNVIVAFTDMQGQIGRAHV